MTKKQNLLKISKKNSGNQEMIWATQFSTMGGPVGDPWICAYPQHYKTKFGSQILATNFGIFFVVYVMFSEICSMWV